MPRTDGNKIAFHALKSILAGATPTAVTIGGVNVALDVRRDENATYPREVEGVSLPVDGPWPPPLRIEATWPTGKARIEVRASVANNGKYRGLVGLEATLMSRQTKSQQQLIWVTLPSLLTKVADGSRCEVVGHATVFTREGEEGRAIDQLKEDQRRRLAEHGLEFKGKSVRLFALIPPDSTPLPSADDALRNIILTALIKMPYFARTDPTLVEGAQVFSIATPVPPTSGASGAAPTESTGDERHAGVWPLPGGVRSYMGSLEVILGWLLEEPRDRTDVTEFFRDRFGVTGSTSLAGYINLMTNIGVAAWVDDHLEVTSHGLTFLQLVGDARAEYLFDLLQSTFTGFVETLVITSRFAPIAGRRTNELLQRTLGAKWRTANQASFRRNWLLSLGLTDRDDGDTLTALGERVLRKYSSERAAIWAALDDASKEEPTPVEPPDAAAESLPPTLTVELLPKHVERHLGGLALSPRLISMASAALSVGHHLLLVGPPGTGKTELAVALAAAARADDYADDYAMVTASADWTTFDTIGGYALEPTDGRERMIFRPGVFASAVEKNQWLIIDELNRADVDKAFGELMTVLAGRGVTTSFKLDGGRSLSFGRVGDSSEPVGGWTHPIAPTFRLLATMNTWDKTSLFRLSYALQRRFAILHVDVPDDTAFANLLAVAAKKEGADPPLADETLGRLKAFFSSKGLLEHRAVGPAIALDIVRYSRRRTDADGLSEAMELFLLPQLEGLNPSPARQVRDLLGSVLGPEVSQRALAHLMARYADLFPNLEVT